MIRSLVVLVAALIAMVAVPAGAQQEIEREPLTFAQIAALDELTQDHAEVLRLYWAFFDREPDPLGALYWLDQFEQCQSLQAIASLFNSSPEFVSTYGDLTNTTFVNLVYRNVLDRSPDVRGHTYWLELIDRNAISRSDLMVLFSVSGEFKQSHPLPSEDVPGRGCRVSKAVATPRVYSIESWPAFATVGDLTILQPSAAAELIGFHQSNHDGAQSFVPLESSTAMITMESRNRDTTRRGAADIAAHPLVEIRAPVTGTVKRAGGYILYCRYTDDYLVIEPDDHPGWEVKLLHINDVQVRAGDRVVAGVTVVAPSPNQLPFSSQIDQLTASPSWPHVHIEVVDPSIPDRPSPGGGC